jgi:hypothetical protein
MIRITNKINRNLKRKDTKLRILLHKSQRKTFKIGRASYLQYLAGGLNLVFLFGILFISVCNMASARDNNGSELPVAGVIPFQTSKELDAVFFRKNKELKKVYEKSVSMLPPEDPFTIELYMQEESPDDGPEWDYKAILRIGDYYYPLRLGTGHSVSIVDIKGTKGPEKILVIATGCFSDAGCMDLTYVIRVFSDQPFTITEFDGELLERKKAMSVADYKRLKSQGALLMHFYLYIGTEDCALEDSAFEFNGRGFRKIWNKREKVECAG